MDHITELFCILDDFCKKFNESLEKALISDQKIRIKKSALSLSEAMTIVDELTTSENKEILVPEHVKPEPRKRGLFGRVLNAVFDND